MDYFGLKSKYATILTFSVISYINTLFGGFVFDDSEAIVKNKDVMPSSPLAEVFQNDFWGTEIAVNLSHKSYRPLTILSYRFNVYLANNKLNAFHFHATNIILYSLTCVLVYKTLKKFVKKKTAYFASLLFAVHPIHTEVVASLVGRADLLSAIAFLMSLIVYARVLKSCSILSTLFFYFVNLFIVFCGVLCKETAITVLGVCFMLELINNGIFYHLKVEMRLRTACMARCAGLIAACLGIMYFRLWIMGFEGPIFTKMDNAAAYSDNLFTKVLSYNYIYFLNVLLLLWPHWLCFDWSMGCVPLIEKTSDIRILCVYFLWLNVGYMLFGLYCQYKKGTLSNETLLGASLLVLPFLPASNLFIKVGFVIAERALFLPSVGFCLLMAHGFTKLAKEKRVAKKHFYTICVILMAKTICRNFDWLSEESLFTSALNVCPLNAKVHYNVAKVAADKHNVRLAIDEYQRALDLNPDYEQAMNNLANILRENRQFPEAERLLRRAVAVRPNFAAAWMNLGIVLATLNQSIEAEECYLTAISYRPKYPDCYYNLGNLYLDLKMNQKALQAWEMAVHYRPTHTAAWSNTLVLLDSLNQYDEVLMRGRTALMHNPTAPALHFSIANTLGKLQEFERAEKHFLEALNFNPYNALYYSNLGVLYHRWGNVEKAREMYKKALVIDPNMKTTENNLRKLLNANTNTSNLK